MGSWWVKSLFWYNLYSTLSWAWTVAGWETTLSRARSVVGWETKLRGASHWILVSYPAGAAAGSYIASVSSYPAGAAAGSYIASVSSSSSFFFFFFFLSTSLFLLQLTWYDHVTQVIFISLMTATKLMGLEIHLGSFGVTGVKKVNHVKNMKTALI